MNNVEEFYNLNKLFYTTIIGRNIFEFLFARRLFIVVQNDCIAHLFERYLRVYVISF